MRISYSALDTYKTCPLKFKWQNLEKIRTARGKEAVFGNAVHEALKFMFTSSPLFPTLDETADYFRNSWEELKEKNKVIWNEAHKKEVVWDDKEANAYLETGISILTNFYKRNQPWNFNVLNLESRFDVILEDPEREIQHILTGVIDRIDKNPDGTYEIIDYKTSSRMPSQERLNSDLQMSIYHLGLMKQWPHIEPRRIKSSLYFLKHGEKITTTRSPEELQKNKKIILSFISEIEECQKSDHFPPLPSALCGWCGYRPMCPMWRHEYKSSQPTVASGQMEEIIKEYFELKGRNLKNSRRISEIQETIHQFMNQEKVERVFGDMGYITRSVKTAEVYHLEKVKEILEPKGYWSGLLKLDQPRLEKLLPTLPQDIQTQIKTAAILETRQTKMLTATKKKFSQK